MNKSGWNLSVVASVTGAVIASAGVFWACSSSSSAGPSSNCTAANGTNNSPATPAPTCAPTAGLPPGTQPPANCDNSAQACPACGGLDLSKCQSHSLTTCEPLSDNAGKSKLDFRIRRLNVAAPPPLAATFIQTNVVTAAIDLNEKACGEGGTGLFNWLIEVDKTAGTIKTGGSPPSMDPFGAGFCFYNHVVDTGQNVQPVSAPITFSGSTFNSTASVGTLNVPIFLSGSPLTAPVILPIQGATLENVAISTDGNCIGTFNPAALDNSGHDDPSQCSKWNTAGSLGGFITLKDADGVNVSLLSESLCALLTGSKDPASGKCTADVFPMGATPGKGDYCSTTKTAGACKDSFWLASTFAASAVTINSGSSEPLCQPGGMAVDAGTDAPTTSDSGSDAADATGD